MQSCSRLVVRGFVFRGEGGVVGGGGGACIKVGKVRKEKRKKGSLIRCGIP